MIIELAHWQSKLICFAGFHRLQAKLKMVDVIGICFLSINLAPSNKEGVTVGIKKTHKASD